MEKDSEKLVCYSILSGKEKTMNVKRKVVAIVLGMFLVIGTASFGFGVSSSDVFSGGFLSAKSLKYAMENYGTVTSEAQTAIAQWNGVSSKVKISHSNVSSAHIKLSLGRLSPPTDSSLGITKLTNSGVAVGTSQKWTNALCIRYNSKYLNTTAKKIETTTHEIGHALSMAHCKNFSHSCRMQQGAQSTYTLASHDKEKLRYKWGS